MTTEEKTLLLKDLCARVPYRVMIKDTYSGHYGRLVEIGNTFVYFISELNSNTLDVQLCHVKPYLRPMSSMTDEEYNDLCVHCSWVWHNDSKDLTKIRGDYKCYDWLNEHHFDYRSLIKKGLALKAPEGMYK